MLLPAQSSAPAATASHLLLCTQGFELGPIHVSQQRSWRSSTNKAIEQICVITYSCQQRNLVTSGSCGSQIPTSQ